MVMVSSDNPYEFDKRMIVLNTLSVHGQRKYSIETENNTAPRVTRTW